MKALQTLTAAIGLAVSMGPVLAEEGPPSLDIEKTCGSPGRTQVQVNQQDGEEGCLRSERAAHDELKKRWSEFPGAAKSQCTKQAQAGGFPSYVETITCLELATGGAPAATGADSSGAGPTPNDTKVGTGRGKDLTAEPSPSQRTNPIDVLEKKR